MALSLRARFSIAVASWLVVSLAVLGVMELNRARAGIQSQMNLSLGTSSQFWGNLKLFQPQANQMADLNRLIRMFDNNHHFRVALKDGNRELIASHPADADLAPGWYASLMAIPVQTRVAKVYQPSGYRVVITTEPQMEIYRAWEEFRDGALILGLSSLVLLIVLDVTVKHVTASLRRLKTGFEAVGGGDYEASMAPGGPRDIADLANAFNRMTMQLRRLSATNANLSRQLTNIQEEERTELARDLHDETAPLLFSLRLDVEAIRAELLRAGDRPLADRAFAVTEAVGRVQHHIRVVLKRLRGDNLAETGLKLAINNLVLFWKRHRAGLDVHLDMKAEGFNAEVDSAIYRVVQESLTNVARHSGATDVWIAVKSEGHIFSVEVEDNGIGGVDREDEGFGLTGMRERLAALGGSLTLKERTGGGTRLVASIPRRKVRELAL